MLIVKIFLIQNCLNATKSYQHYQHCVDAFIEQAVHQLTEKGLDDDLFHQIEDLIEHVTPQITQGNDH